MTNRVGQQLGNYQLIRLLGRGGFAEVYLGEHIYLKSLAALKVLHTFLEKEEVGSFVKEAQTLVRLIHPHIVRVLDFAVEQGIPFLVMDYAPNGTLRQRHPKDSQLPLATIITYVKQLAEAIQYAHDERLIHRDIKPGNMLLGRRNEVLLSDFGIAVIARNTGSLSMQGQGMAGTASYIAPEQIMMRPRPASDQYSLGVVVYEWICGIPPFQGTQEEILNQHLSMPPPPLRARVLTLPQEVEDVVLRALAKDPHQRFASVQDFASALEQAYLLSEQARSATPLNEPTLPPVRITSPILPSIQEVMETRMHQPTPPPGSTFAPSHQTVQPKLVITKSQVTSPPPVTPTPRLEPSESPTVPPPSQPAITSNSIGLTPQASHSLPGVSSSSTSEPILPPLPKITKRFGSLSRNTIVLLSILIFFVIVGSIFFSFATGIVFLINPHPTPTNPPAGRATTLATHSTPQATHSVTIQATPSATPQVLDYPMFGFNSQHTNFNPNEKAISPSNVSRLVLYWSFNAGIFVQSSPVVANGVVYVGSGDGTVYAVNATTGATLWNVFTGNTIQTSFSVVDGVAYIGSDKLYAFNATTGTRLWTASTGSTIFSSPTVMNGVVYIGSDDGNLYAFDAKTGSNLWIGHTAGGSTTSASSSSPAVADGVVYIGSNDKKVYAFNAATGKLLWTAATGYKIFASPTVTNGVVYVGSDDGTFYAFNAKTGAGLWTYTTGQEFGLGDAPAVANGMVYVGSGFNLYAFNATTEKLLWTAATGGYTNGSLAVANGVVYVGSTDKKLYAFDARTGASLWTYTTGDFVNSPPTVANGVVYVGSDDRKLYAFHLPGTTS